MSRRALPILLVSLLAAAGCTRRTELMPASADSTRVRPDSFAVAARTAADRWEAGENDDAASATARLLLLSMRLRPNAPWVERARGLLDSLGIAAEVAGGERALAVNLFSRGDPEGASWPLLFWHEKDGPHVQPLDVRGVRLVDLAARGFSAGSLPTDSAQVAVLWGRRVGGGTQPQLVVWSRRAGAPWVQAQVLGADSLGGVGTGEFAVTDTSTDLETRTFRSTPGFDECATCPHVFRARRFAWGRDGFHVLDNRLVPSPYATFAAFVAALQAGDRDGANQRVVDPSLVEFAHRYDWQDVSRGRWRVAPETDESAQTMIFFRGTTEAYRVTFESRAGDWVIAGFEPTKQTVD